MSDQDNRENDILDKDGEEVAVTKAETESKNEQNEKTEKEYEDVCFICRRP